MRAALAFAMIMLFTWNSVLGGMDALVLCLHSDGDAHVEMMGKDVPEAEAECVGRETTIAGSNCPPCTDLVLGMAELGSMRAVEMGSVQPPIPSVARGEEPYPEAAYLPRLQVAVSHPTRGPPEVEPASELISRVIVLRL